MASYATITVIFILAAALDYLSVKWQKHREEGNRSKVALLSMLLELLGWVPVWLAITTQDYMVVVASVVGSGLGAFMAVERISATTLERTPASGVVDYRQE